MRILRTELDRMEDGVGRRRTEEDGVVDERNFGDLK